MWVWVNTYRYIFSGMNIHLPAILGFTRYQGFDPSPCQFLHAAGGSEETRHSIGGGAEWGSLFSFGLSRRDVAIDGMVACWNLHPFSRHTKP